METAVQIACMPLALDWVLIGDAIRFNIAPVSGDLVELTERSSDLDADELRAHLRRLESLIELI